MRFLVRVRMGMDEEFAFFDNKYDATETVKRMNNMGLDSLNVSLYSCNKIDFSESGESE